MDNCWTSRLFSNKIKHWTVNDWILIYLVLALYDWGTWDIWVPLVNTFCTTLKIYCGKEYTSRNYEMNL